MTRFWFIAVGFASLAVFSSCGDKAVSTKMPASARAALESAEKLELFSLDPDRHQRIDEADDQKAAAGTHFHGWKVLGSTQLTDRLERSKIIQMFQKGVDESGDAAASCFIPRHGIRVVANGKTVDFVICFQCFRVEWFEDDQHRQAEILIARSPEPAFDRALKQAGVPLAPKGPS